MGLQPGEPNADRFSYLIFLSLTNTHAYTFSLFLWLSLSLELSQPIKPTTFHVEKQRKPKQLENIALYPLLKAKWQISKETHTANMRRKQHSSHSNPPKQMPTTICSLQKGNRKRSVEKWNRRNHHKTQNDFPTSSLPLSWEHKSTPPTYHLSWGKRRTKRENNQTKLGNKV